MRGIRAGRWLFVVACMQLFGCELIADFDRGKIDDGGTPDANFRPRDAGKQPDEDAGEDAGD